MVRRHGVTSIQGVLMRRLVIALSAFALASSTLGIGTAQATPPTTATAILNSQGAAAAALGTGSVVNVRTDAPVTVVGDSSQIISQTIDSSHGLLASRNAINGQGQTVQVPDVTAPEGYTVEYNDGSSWSQTAPTLDSATNTYPGVAGVRASGAISVTGYANHLEQVSRTATAVAEAGTTFQGTSGGDGWDVFFGSGPAAGRVFNIFHHSGGDFTMDCHLRDGTPCWGALYSSNPDSTVPATYYTSAHSTGFYVAASDSVYSFVANGAGDFGMVCATNVSTSNPVPCPTPFVTLAAGVGATGVWQGNSANDAVLVGTKVFARGTGSGNDMLCFDTVTEQACVNQPFSLGQPSGDNSFENNRLMAIDTNIYFTTGDNVGCFDSVTKTLCAGFNSGAIVAGSNAGPLFYSTDVSGVPNQICAYTSTTCWGLDGTTGAWPAGLRSSVFSYASLGWGIDLNIGSKFYYLEGDSADCFDFSTGADCTDYSPPALGRGTYTMRVDPANTWCLWSNSDSGQIVTFSPQTGASPCAPPLPAVIVPYAAAVPRMGCTDAGRVVSWGSLTITPPGVEPIAQARVTVQDSGGHAIDGWTDLIPNSQGLIDLTTLTVAETGLRPTYEVYYQDASDPSGTTGTFTYSAVAPQMCVGVKTLATCPTGVGNGASVFPYSEASLTGASSVSVTTGSADPVVEDTSATATRVVSAPECLTGITGYVYRHRSGTNPVQGITVRLLDSGDHVLATAVTDSSGHYAFDHVYPNSYFAEADGISTLLHAIPYVSGDSTDMPDLVIPNMAPSVATLSSTQYERTTKRVLILEGMPVSVLSATGHCTASGVNVTFTTPGACTITVTQGSSVVQTIHVTVVSALVLSRPPSSIQPGRGWAIVGKQGTPPVVVTATGSCVVTGTNVFFGYPGSCRITVKKAGVVVATYTVAVTDTAPARAGSLSMSHASVYFNPDSSALTKATTTVLKALVPKLLAAHTVMVVGFTTSSVAGPGGVPSSTLSKARATAVANYLHARGVNVTLKAGVSRLGNPGFGVASNRRVDLSWK